MAKGHGKGSQWERDLARKLSLWWSQDWEESEDGLLWRSSQSGGRATIRSRKGKKTPGSYGDLTALDSRIDLLIKCICFECKRGYPKFTLTDLLDKEDNSAKQKWEEWIEQAELSRKNAGSKYWMIISKRNQKKAICVFPWRFWYQLDEIIVGFRKTRPFLIIKISNYDVGIIAMTFEDWLKKVSPEDIKTILERPILEIT